MQSLAGALGLRKLKVRKGHAQVKRTLLGGGGERIRFRKEAQGTSPKGLALVLFLRSGLGSKRGEPYFC